MLREEELKSLALRGLIVGPYETEENFALRVEQAERKETIDLSDLYGIKPDWIDYTEDQRGLSWFHGAATWIEGNQVRIRLKKNRWVSKEEMLRHEAVHAVRCQFDEPRFEEIFAYATSCKKYRRLIGPLFRDTKQTWGLVISCFAGILWPWAPYFVIGAYGLILRFYQRRFAVTLGKIRELLPEGEDPIALALHLTDEEILHFRSELIKQDSLRWRQIRSRFSLTST